MFTLLSTLGNIDAIAVYSLASSSFIECVPCVCVCESLVCVSECSVRKFVWRVSLWLSVCRTSLGTKLCSHLEFVSGAFSLGLNFDGR